MLSKSFLFIAALSTSAVVIASPSDRFQMASGFNPGKLDVSVFGAPKGVVDRVSKAYLAAGAVKTEHTGCPACPYTTIEFVNDSSQAIIINPANGSRNGAPGGGPAGMNYQWNFDLSIDDNIAINYMGATLGFSGAVAESLYTGLAKTAAEVVGQTPDEKGDFTVPIYAARTSKYSIECRRQEKLTHCSFLVK